MAEWIEPLPDTAVEGETTHIEDHNKLVSAVVEVRVNVNGVASDLAGKADAEHTHSEADVTGLTAALAAKVDDSEVSADLQATGDNSIPRRANGRIKATSATDGDDVVNKAQLDTAIATRQASGSYAAASHTHTVANVTGLQAQIDGKQAAGSYATTAQLAGKVAGVGVREIRALTITEYDALTPEADVVYLIVPEA